MLMDDTPRTAEERVGGRFGRSLWLASRSPRRRQLLTEHGYEFGLAESGLDDGELHPGNVDPAEWVMALAYLKAIAAMRELDPAQPPRPVLGADTVCVVDGEVVGQPVDADDARRILLAVSNNSHEVLTGVAIVCPTSDRRDVFYERTLVTVGDLSPFIEAYVASGGWRGKAGAYNLAERLAEGWPIEHGGDPTSIMGLPMRLLSTRLEAFCDRPKAG
ncbi:MAG: septum formation protein [Phycisphaerales bacterium]|jgi:septum formation protein